MFHGQLTTVQITSDKYLSEEELQEKQVQQGKSYICLGYFESKENDQSVFYAVIANDDGRVVHVPDSWVE